jgi:hypothetical protein
MSDGASTKWASRRPRHSVELGALDVLDDHQPSGLVDVADPARSVAAASGEDDRHGARTAVLGQGPKEDVDRQRPLLMSVLLAQEQTAAGDDHLVLGRDQIDVLRLDRHPVLHEMDRQLGVPRQELVHHALEVGRQVLNDHERQARSLGQVVEEAFDRFEAAGGGADPHDVRWCLRSEGHVRPRASHFREVKHRQMPREWPSMLT